MRTQLASILVAVAILGVTGCGDRDVPPGDPGHLHPATVPTSQPEPDPSDPTDCGSAPMPSCGAASCDTSALATCQDGRWVCPPAFVGRCPENWCGPHIGRCCDGSEEVCGIQAGGGSTPTRTCADGSVPQEFCPHNQPEQLGNCFEIFAQASGAGADEVPGAPHSNPMVWNLGTVGVGATSTVSIRYYNFCSEPNLTVVSTELLAPGGAPLDDPSFQLTLAPADGTRYPWAMGPSSDPIFEVTLKSDQPGTHKAMLRVRFNIGYYETDLEATVAAPTP
jgi:hypothetical protein